MALEVTIRKITSRYDDSKTLWAGKASSLKEALVKAVAARADLRGANLRDADLRGANLGDANLWDADLRGANLRDADLRGANLRDANLGGANFRGANLGGANNLRLPTGETWTAYLTETVPALLTAGGKSLESFAAHFRCHDWTNCPIAHAFDVHRVEDVPVLLQPRAEQFMQFFDARQIRWPLPTKADLEQPVEATPEGT